ncbi:MAG: aminotransferase class III-fold pyridoxal phosphate-dependent enzyme, partial [Solirubrobacterales bacterium]|nr:aminotransferase class III-fold pyridoxal phosphate-dependent enzyme [Solirubrobacterales bacterium]
MSGESSTADFTSAVNLETSAKRHLMLHFSDMKSLVEEGITIIERGEGVHVFDMQGDKYIDGLSGLYCASLGHSYGDEIGEVAHEQWKKLPYATNWTVAHPPSIELAEKIASLA